MRSEGSARNDASHPIPLLLPLLVAHAKSIHDHVMLLLLECVLAEGWRHPSLWCRKKH